MAVSGTPSAEMLYTCPEFTRQIGEMSSAPIGPSLPSL
jgi:hypothetical protein